MVLVVAAELLKFGAGEKIEVALAPVRAPGIAFASGGFHFSVGVSEMDDKLGDARFEMLEGIFVEVRPLCGRNAGFDGDDTVDDDVIGSEAFFEIRKI